MNFVRLLRVHQAKVLCNYPARCIFNHPMKFTDSQNRWRDIDNISKEYHLVYKGPLEKWLKILTTYLTASTGAISCASVYYFAFDFDLKDFDNPLLLGDVVIANSAYECLIYLTAFIGFHLALKLMLSKVLVRLYQDGDNYIAIFRGHLYNDIMKQEFQRKDVVKLKTIFFRSWPDARYSLGKKHAIIFDHYFKTPEHFNYLVSKYLKPDPNR